MPLELARRPRRGENEPMSRRAQLRRAAAAVAAAAALALGAGNGARAGPPPDPIDPELGRLSVGSRGAAIPVEDGIDLLRPGGGLRSARLSPSATGMPAVAAQGGGFAAAWPAQSAAAAASEAIVSARLDSGGVSGPGAVLAEDSFGNLEAV